MTTIEVPNFRWGYTKVCQHVLAYGDEVSPRGMKTREVLGATIIVNEPRDALPIGTGRKLNTAIGAGEALQLIAGVSVPDMMTSITKNFAQFKLGGTFHGAYGPRLRPQMSNVIGRLVTDRDTRQAVATIWDPLYDGQDDVRDLPCTNHLQFMVRGGRLDLHVTMRSNDVWWGLAYDVFQFTQLQLFVARVMGIQPGTYYHHANSLHAYVRDWPAIEKLTYPEGSLALDLLTQPWCYGWDGWIRKDSWQSNLLDGREEATNLLSGEWNASGWPGPIGARGAEWYYEQLNEHV